MSRLTSFRFGVLGSSLVALLLGVSLVALWVLIAPQFNSKTVPATAIVAPSTGPSPPTQSADKSPTRAAAKADLASLTFADPLVSRRFTWFDDFAKSVARDDWHHRPYQSYSNKMPPAGYFAEWATFADKQGRNPINYHGPRECHCLRSQILCDPNKPDHVTWVSLSTRWKPADPGWSAQIVYCTANQRPVLHGRGHEQFSMHFQHHPTLDEPGLQTHTIMIERAGSAFYSSWFKVDELVYEISVNTLDHSRHIALEGRQPDAEIRRIIATAESFRDFAVEVFERLAAKIETDFADGSAISSARENRTPAGNEDPDLLYNDRPMTAKEKELCLETARAEVQARIRMIKKHYREMYAAANLALPLLDLTADR